MRRPPFCGRSPQSPELSFRGVDAFLFMTFRFVPVDASGAALPRIVSQWNCTGADSCNCMRTRCRHTIRIEPRLQLHPALALLKSVRAEQTWSVGWIGPTSQAPGSGRTTWIGKLVALAWQGGLARQDPAGSSKLRGTATGPSGRAANQYGMLSSRCTRSSGQASLARCRIVPLEWPATLTPKAARCERLVDGKTKGFGGGTHLVPAASSHARLRDVITIRRSEDDVAVAPLLLRFVQGPIRIST